MVELGRSDMYCEVSMISSHLALPREGHLIQVFYIFTYIKNHHNTCLVFDLSYSDINPDTFQHHDWTKCYDNMKKTIPPDMPRPLGREVFVRCFVDEDHAGEQLTQRSQTCFIIFV